MKALTLTCIDCIVFCCNLCTCHCTVTVFFGFGDASSMPWFTLQRWQP